MKQILSSHFPPVQLFSFVTQSPVQGSSLVMFSKLAVTSEKPSNEKALLPEEKLISAEWTSRGQKLRTNALAHHFSGYSWFTDGNHIRALDPVHNLP